MKEFLDLYDDNKILAITSDNFKKNEFVSAAVLKTMNFEGKENVYFAPNSLRVLKGKVWRDSEHFNSYECLYCDIDLEHITDCELIQINTDAIKDYLLNHVLCDDFLPEPTMVISSGHGLHVYWKIRPTRDKIKWEKMQDIIAEKLEKYGSDRKVSHDKIHVLRVPGTINKKECRKPVPVEKLVFNEYIYDIDNLVSEYIPYFIEKKKERSSRANKRYNPKKNCKKAESEDKQKKVIPFYEKLYVQRCEDLEKLYKMRDYSGSREMILFLYRYYQEHITQSDEIALNRTLELNRTIKNGLSEKEVKTRTKSAHKYHEKMQQLNISTQYIVDTLGITEEEMKSLKYLISSKIKADRKKKYNREYYTESLLIAGKISKADAINIRRTKIKRMIEQGQERKEICESLSISRATYFNDVKAANDPDFIESIIVEEIEEEKTGTDDFKANRTAQFGFKMLQSKKFRHTLSISRALNGCVNQLCLFSSCVSPPDS